jgi:putative hydrolase of the HAD superfamily
VSLDAILFDLDDTLVPERPAIVAGYAAIAERVWEDTGDDRTRALHEAARALWLAGRPTAYAKRVHFSTGEALYGEFIAEGPEPDALRAFVPALRARAFEAALPPRASGRSPELIDLWKATRMRELSAYPETVQVLEHWRARLPLALVTNGASRLQRAKLAATGLERFFEVIIVAEEVGVGKPDPAPFHAALSQLGLEPEAVVMVGNDVGRDIAGARNAGIRSVHVDRERRSATIEAIADLTELETRLRTA